MSVGHADVFHAPTGRCATRAAIVFSLFVPIALSAQPSPQVELNHLDCWYDEGAKAMQCPPVDDLQTGRASRVDRAFEATEPPARNPVPVPVPAPAARQSAPAPKPPRSVTAEAEGPRTPSCPKYKTYDAATNTYRGYDGVVRKCRQ